MGHPSTGTVLAAALGLSTVVSAAQAPPVPPSWAAVEKALSEENYREARRLSDFLLQAGRPEDRKAVVLAYGRILLGLSEKTQARQYLKTLAAQEPQDRDAGQRAAIYQAWLTALEGKPEAAIGSLEKTLVENRRLPSTPEAADVLAMLYLQQGQTEKAKRAVEFGLKLLDYEGTKSGYVRTLLAGRLSGSNDPARRAYDAAEALREQGKFSEAGRAFLQLRAAFPASDWFHAAGFRLGQCWAGMGQVEKAFSHWETFIAEKRDGPWRGQAHVAAVDLALQSRLDLPVAVRHAAAGAAVLDRPAADLHATWRQCQYDLRLRQGMVSLVDRRYEAAATALTQATSVAHAAPPVAHAARVRTPVARAARVRAPSAPSPSTPRPVGALRPRRPCLPGRLPGHDLPPGGQRGGGRLHAGRRREHSCRLGPAPLLTEGNMLMKRLWITAGSLLAVAGVLVVAYLGRGPAADADAGGPEQPAAAVNEPPAPPQPHAGTSEGEKKEDWSLPASFNSSTVIQMIQQMEARGTPKSTAFAAKLREVLEKYHVKLPARATGAGAVQPPPNPKETETEALARQTRTVVSEVGWLRHMTIDDPLVLQRFYADVCQAVVEHSPTERGRMAAARVLLEAAYPPWSDDPKPKLLLDPKLAGAAAERALEAALDAKDGESIEDSAEAMLYFVAGNGLSEYLTVRTIGMKPEEAKSFVETLDRLRKKADAFPEPKMPFAKTALLQLKEKLGGGRKSVPTILEMHRRNDEIKQFVRDMVAAVNAEDMAKLSKVLPSDGAKQLAEAKSIRDAWAGAPHTKAVVIHGFGSIVSSPIKGQVTVYYRFVGTDGKTKYQQSTISLLRERDQWRVVHP